MTKVPIRLKSYRRRREERPNLSFLFLLFIVIVGFFFFLVIGGVRSVVKWRHARDIHEVYFYPSKKTFGRFEFVEIFLKVKKQGGQTLLTQPVLEIFDDKNEAVVSAGFIHKRRFVYDGRRRIWVATWPVPWNASGGTYTARAKIALKNKVKTTENQNNEIKLPLLRWFRLHYPKSFNKQTKPKVTEKEEVRVLNYSVDFKVSAQKAADIHPKLRVLTIESSRDMLNGRFMGPDGKVSNESLYAWAKFLGANAIWYLAGQTASWGVKSEDDVWQKINLKSFPELAKRARARGCKFGGWIACYLTFGKKHFKKYRYAYDYEPRLHRCVPRDAVSLMDENRLYDIVAVAKKLQSDPNVDYIGLDYIRSAAGGYEMVDEFVRDMQPEVPDGFFKRTKEQRMNWLGEQIALKKFAGWEGKDFYELWSWWRAHKVASVVHEIIERAKITKPVWTFTLGWEHGFQHGQDTPMLVDAGVSVDAVMLYEITKPLFPFMMKAWRTYLKPGQSPLIAGNTVDWNLHDKSFDPPGPQEFYNRLMEGVTTMNGGGKIHGAFFHDFDRLIYGRKGPFPALEWAIAGADAFSRVQELWDEVPYATKIMAQKLVVLEHKFPVSVSVKNVGAAPLTDVTINVIKTQGVKINGDETHMVSSLKPQKEKNVSFSCSVDKKQPRRIPMIAVEILQGAHRLVNFVYVHVKEPLRPKEKKKTKKDKENKDKKEKKSKSKDKQTKRESSSGRKKQAGKIRIKAAE